MLAQAEDPLRGFEPRAQLVHIDRLRDEVVRARFHAFEVAFFSTGRCDQEKVGIAVRGSRTHPPTELGTVHLGHRPIRNDDREIAKLQVAPGLAAVLRFSHLVAEALEDGAQRHPSDGVVFGQEDVHAVRPGGFEPPTNSLEGCCSIHLSYGGGSRPNNLTRNGSRSIPPHRHCPTSPPTEPRLPARGSYTTNGCSTKLST